LKALVLDRGLHFDPDFPDPCPAAGEVLIAVRLAGVCNSDLEMARGYMQFRGVPGHEFVGTVLEAREPGWVGERVVGEINCSCGTCELCRAGLSRHCPRRTVLGILGRNGAFAERTVLPLVNLHRVPDTVSDEEAVFVEPVAACCEVLDQVDMRAFADRAVLGDGKLGLLAAQVLAESAGPVTLIGKHPEKMKLVAGERIRTQVLEATEVTPAFDLVVECTGSPAGLSLATDLVRPRGTIVLKTTTAESPPVPAARWVVDEITVVGSRCGRFEPAIELIAGGRLKLRELISRRVPLSEAVSAFDSAREPGALKVLIDVQAG